MSKQATAVRRQAGVRLPLNLLEQVDEYCRTHPLSPSRTKVIELAIREFVEKHGKAAAKSAA